MDAKNLARNLRKLVRRQPFRPFLVELVSGTAILVEHPEALAFGGRSAVYIDKEEDLTLFDCDEVSKVTTKIDRSTAS